MFKPGQSHCKQHVGLPELHVGCTLRHTDSLSRLKGWPRASPVCHCLHLQQVPHIKGMLNKQEQHRLKYLPVQAGAEEKPTNKHTVMTRQHNKQQVVGAGVRSRIPRYMRADSRLLLSPFSHLTELPKTKVSANTVAEKVEKPFTLHSTQQTHKYTYTQDGRQSVMMLCPTGLH